MHKIMNSLVNGQKKQMVDFIDAYGEDFWRDLEEFQQCVEGQPTDVAYCTYVNITAAYQEIKSYNLIIKPDAPNPIEALKALYDTADLVRADITDQDTGWYYQFIAAIEKASRAIREAQT